MDDREELLRAVVEYGRTIQRDGWKAGEAVILKYEPGIPDFRRWAYALGIMLRAEELLAGLAQQ
jgi:hypothetical protein